MSIEIAKAVLRETMARLEYFSACDFCEAGKYDDDGGNRYHSDDCPLFGYDNTEDWERLKAWAKS